MGSAASFLHHKPSNNLLDFNASAVEESALKKGAMARIHQLLKRLEGDSWRRDHPFSADINTACEVLLNPHARDDERKTAIRGWLTKFQPCVFGQVAAQGDRLFISIIDEKLLDQGDKAVKEKLQSDKRTWKQWSLGEKGKHGFLIVVLSPKLHYAAPNRALRDLAKHIRSLFAPDSKSDPVGNDMVYAWLFLNSLSNYPTFATCDSRDHFS